MDTLSSIDMALLVGGVIATAIIAGVMAGLLGVGGGIVLVPVLFWILSATDFPPDISMHMAVATSLATIIFTSISSARAHHKRDAVNVDIVRRWAVFVLVGALLGAWIASQVHSRVPQNPKTP